VINREFGIGRLVVVEPQQHPIFKTNKGLIHYKDAELFQNTRMEAIYSLEKLIELVVCGIGVKFPLMNNVIMEFPIHYSSGQIGWISL
jgi:hypothetical protein